MSLEDISLPFLKISDLPDKFKVCVSGWSEEETQYTKEGKPQKVLKVILIGDDGQTPIKNSPPANFLSMSNHAQKALVRLGIRHLKELTGKIVTFKKADVNGFSSKTIEPTKIEAW